jgi:hypothetical protein
MNINEQNMGQPAVPGEICPLPEDAKPAAVRLRLYIARSTPNSVRAEQNLAAALKEMSEENRELELEIVDVFTHPKRALTDSVMITPTLIRIGTNGRSTMIGDLSDGAKLRLFLRSL